MPKHLESCLAEIAQFRASLPIARVVDRLAQRVSDGFKQLYPGD